MMGGSLAVTRMSTLSMPSPVRADSTCSTVWTLASPRPRLVPRTVVTTKASRAGIIGQPGRSSRKKRMPALAGAGRKRMRDELPVCRPTPSRETSVRIVVWRGF